MLLGKSLSDVHIAPYHTHLVQESEINNVQPKEVRYKYEKHLPSSMPRQMVGTPGGFFGISSGSVGRSGSCLLYTSPSPRD